VNKKRQKAEGVRIKDEKTGTEAQRKNTVVSGQQ